MSPSTVTPVYVEEACIYTFTRVFGPNETQRGLAVVIDPDSDFLLTGLNGSSTGLYSINFRLPSGRLISNNQVQSVNLIGTANQPTAIGPAPQYRQSSLGPALDISELSGAPNTIEIVFTGIRRLRTA